MSRTKYEHNGLRGLSAIAQAAGVTPNTLISRMSEGMTLAEAVELGKNRPCKYIFEGMRGQREIAEHLGCSPVTLRAYLEKHGTVEDAAKHIRGGLRERTLEVEGVRKPSMDKNWKLALGVTF